MKARIKVVPAQFGNGYMQIALHMDGRNILEREIDVKNIAQLTTELDRIRSEVTQSAYIMVRPLSRKIPGFDAFQKANREAFQCKH